MLPSCLTKPVANAFLRLRLGFIAGVGKGFVDGLGDAPGVVGIINLTTCTSRPCLSGGPACAPESIPTGTTSASHPAESLCRVNGVEIELPVAGVYVALDGDAVANFPAKSLGRRAPTTAPWRSFTKLFHWSSGTLQFGIDLALVFNVDGELGEKVLRVLINAAEPVHVGDQRHAFDLPDLVHVGKRHRC